MKRLKDRKSLIIYTLVSVFFILILGVLFVQIAKHYVVEAYEKQHAYDSKFIQDDFELTAQSSSQEIQQKLEYYSDSFPVDLVFYNHAKQEYLHTFSSQESKPLNEVLSGQLSTEGMTLKYSRLFSQISLSDQHTLFVISNQLPIDYLNTTIWWIVIMLMVLVGVLIWGIGNRLFENYVTPIRKAALTAQELSEGNYKARIQDAPYGIASELSQSINMLARNLEHVTSKYENQNDRLKTVVNNMESGLLLINEKGLTRLTNESFIENFADHKEIIGEIYYEVINQKDLNEAIQKVIFMERKDQVTIRTNSGKYFEVYLAPIQHDPETSKGVVIVCHDITKIKQLENVRKDFVANVSHELRTPITSIQGFVETLLNHHEQDPEVINKFLKIIDKETSRINLLIQDLLELSTIEKDDFSLNKTIFKAYDVIHDAQQVVEQSLNKKNLTATIDVPNDIEVYADYHRIYQLILNLYSNAIQYTPSGGKISWRVFMDENLVKFQIQDNGIGIPEEDQDRIFERFYRVNRDRSRDTGGTGLGLSIVKHIVEVHEGQIKLESVTNQGTTITVSIPQPTL